MLDINVVISVTVEKIIKCKWLSIIKYVILKHTDILKLAAYIVQRYFWLFKGYFPTLRKVFLYDKLLL